MSARSTAGTATQAIVLLVARLGFAVILVGRAWYRWQVEGMATQIAQVAAAGLPQAELIAWCTVLLEGLGGALLALGLLTRFVALLVAIQNILIIALLRWPAGLFASDGGFEYNVALACLALVFVAVGASYAGLDALLFGRGRRRAAKMNESVDLYQPKLGSTQL